MYINKDEIQLKEDYINEKYLNRNGDGYYLKVMYTARNKGAVYIFHERHYGKMIVSYELPLNFSTLKLLDYIEIVYSSEMMQRKIDTAAELTRMGYKVNHQSALSTTFNVIDFSLDMILEYYNLIPVKCMDTTYCVIFEDDGTLTSNVNIKYTTVYLESMLSSSSPKYKTVDGNLIKGNFSRSIYMESHQQCKNISFTDEFGIEGIKNFDINNIDKYTNELLKLTENNDCDFYRIKKDN